MDVTRLEEVGKGLGDEIRKLEDKVRALKVNADRLKFLQEVLSHFGIGLSHRIKASNSWYLLDPQGQRMFAREICDDETVVLKPLSEALTQECPNKHPGQLVVETYYQSFQTVAHSEYSYSTFVMCLECRGLYQLHTRAA